ncbi:unnamed protein product, partial [Rangifer tarandus platyrhynchus]
MHHHPRNRERAINLSILSVSGPGEVSHLPSNGSSRKDLKWTHSNYRASKESSARAHRGISPPEASQHRGGPAAHPERQTGLSGHTPHPRGGEGGRTPHGGLTPTATPTPRAAAGPGERSRAASVPDRGGRGWEGTQAAARTGRGGRPAAVRRGRPAHAAGAAGRGRGRRPGDQETPGHSRATRKTSAGSHRHPRTRAVPRRLGRRPFPANPWSGPHTPAPPPGPARGRPTTPGGERLTRGTEPTGRGSSQPPPAARSGERRVINQIKDPHRLAPPPSGRPGTRGGTTSRVGQTHHTGAGAQGPGGRLQRQRPNQAPAGGPKAQSPACIQRPK